jgi:hypothetical protein
MTFSSLKWYISPKFIFIYFVEIIRSHLMLKLIYK